MCSLLLAVCAVSLNPPFINPGTPGGIPPSYDCKARQHAWEFGKATLPQRGEFKTLYDALQLQACGVATPQHEDTWTPPTYTTPTSGVIYADATAASSGTGSEAAPFQTLSAAVAAAAGKAGSTIVLRAGTYHTEQIQLGTAHSGLTIQNYEGEEAVVSGAVPVKVNGKASWTEVDPVHNTWKLDVKGQGFTEMTGLRVGEERAIRAKFPNGHPELSSLHYVSEQYEEGWITDLTTFTPPLDQDRKWSEAKDFSVNGSDWAGVEWPAAEEGPLNQKWTGEGDWGDFYFGMGGFCDDISPPTGYWCSKTPPRGQCYDPVKKTSGGCTQTHMAPSGLSYKDVLPQAANYSNPKGAVVQVWRGGGRWYTNQCQAESINKSSSQLLFSQDVGCNQGGEGSVRANQWWIENVKEECDSPGEFFFDADEEALYYTFNTSQTPTGDEQLVATRTKVLFNVTGTQAAPVRDVAIRGLVIRDAMLTYLGTDVADVHGMPSGGDWALQRSGAILLEGTERTKVDNNLITRVDGNGVFVSNYNRNVTVSNNELSWIGDSAMASWGSTGPCLNGNCSMKVPYGVGPDGRGGNQPRGTTVVGNLVREIGIWQKQSSMWFQAVTSGTTLSQNVHFNGPRAGVNFNDGFGGGDVMEGNLLANCVRESGDHGPFNSWDRLPYITDIGMHRVFTKDNVTGDLPGHELANGPSVIPRFREIRHNFVFDVYSSQEAIDNDDGSSYYLTHNNYFVYAGTGLKSDFGGQWNHHFNNVYAYVNNCFERGNNLAFYNNTCQTNNGNYQSTCSPAYPHGYMTVRDNSVHSTHNVTFCAGDTNSTWSPFLDDDSLTAKGTTALLPFPKSL